MDFSQRLKVLRNINNKTQEDLAKYLGVSRPTIAGYETKGKQPSFETLFKIAEYFDVSIDYLLGKTDIKEPIDDVIKKKELDVFNQIHNLSPESQEEIKKLIELYKMKDMQDRNTKDNDELATLD
ncbi:DNA-binding XRE family transcriptional regulator [Tissierella praeacuta]|uniref:helix-turn-helix domain-containing protein n=1 Tax=Tissierella praeacuta TaxID=43131 RepID=UPI001052AD16|nr:helix-turn-helix transcriptional regulator [Tissierella praeacuta]TCU64164.1 DNA-binding XRE family transcriptional regulator [Tissierella praeacuta]